MGTVSSMPSDKVKCPAASMAFHQRYGYVNVTEVIGDQRKIQWEEMIKEEPISEAHWDRGETGQVIITKSTTVPVAELSVVNPFKPSQAPGKVIEGRFGAARVDDQEQNKPQS